MLIAHLFQKQFGSEWVGRLGDAWEADQGAAWCWKKPLCFDQEKTMHALELSLCVINEMMDLRRGADDSDGVSGRN
jgi:hypothetical protein